MISAGKHETQASRTARAETIHGSFAKHQQELRWLAGFLTGADEVAEACVLDACATAQRFSLAVGHFVDLSATFATIDSAIQIQRQRIAELSRVYERLVCFARNQVSADLLDFVVTNSDVLRNRLDTLCRFALVMRGIEECSTDEVALWLGISSGAVEAAYCAALECIEVMECQTQIAFATDAAAWN